MSFAKPLLISLLTVLWPGDVLAEGEVLFVADGPGRGAEDGIRAALKQTGRRGEDVTTIHRTLHSLVFNYEHPPPQQWPEALNKDWEQGAAACRSQGDGTPFTINNKGAWLCSRELSKVLWQRFLDYKKPELIIEVKLTTLPSKQKVRRDVDLLARAYGPNDTEVRSIVTKSPYPAVKRVTQEVRSLIEGNGKRDRRVVTRKLPEHAGPTNVARMPPTPGPEALAKVDVPASCLDKLPSALTFESETYFGNVIAATWKKSVAGKTAPHACSAELFANQGGFLAGSKMQSIVGSLRCGDAFIQARHLAISKDVAVVPLAGKAVDELIKKRCGGR